MVDLDKPAYRAATQRMLEAVRLVLVRSDSLRAALVRLGCARRKIRHPTHRHSAGRNSAFSPRDWPADGDWQLLQAVSLDREERIAHQPARLRRIRQEYPQRHLSPLPAKARCCDELEDARPRRLALPIRSRSPVLFRQAELRELFYRSHIFLHPSETGAGRQSGRRAEFDARSHGQRTARFRHHITAEFRKRSRTASAACWLRNATRMR